MPAAATDGMLRATKVNFIRGVKLAGLLLSSCVISLPAQADSALSYRLGTFGFALDYNYRLRDALTLRLGYNLYAMSRDADSDGVRYDASLKINAASLLMDWHYNDSPWRLTMGVSSAGPTIEAKGEATGNVTFNGQTYYADQLGRLEVAIKPSNAVAPYIGIGYGRAVGATDRFTLLADLGVLYVGAPTSKVVAQCGSAVASTECEQLMADIRAEAAARVEEWRNLKWWPVVSIGFAMRW